MTVDDLLQGDSFPADTPLAFAEPGSPNNPEPISFHPTQDPISSIDGSIHALGCGSKGGAATGAVAIGFQDDTTPKTSEERIGANRANAGGEGACVQRGMSVRRLTPTECERLQGFPDGHTQIPYRNKPADKCPDGPRYKALGNSMAVPCMAWIGKRIAAVDAKLTANTWDDIEA